MKRQISDFPGPTVSPCLSPFPALPEDEERLQDRPYYLKWYDLSKWAKKAETKCFLWSLHVVYAIVYPVLFIDFSIISTSKHLSANCWGLFSLFVFVIWTSVARLGAGWDLQNMSCQDGLLTRRRCSRHASCSQDDYWKSFVAFCTTLLPPNIGLESAMAKLNIY